MIPLAAKQIRPWALQGRKRSCESDRGAHAVEFAIVAGPLLIVTFMVIQAALVFHARSTALAAATQGAQVARAYNSSAAAGKTKAENFLESIGQGLHDPEVEVTTGPTDITVTVTGHAPSIIPFVTFDVSQTASGPIERFVS